jgi:hypothetical protein
MPTVLKLNRYRFFFFSNEGSEPVHIHVEAADSYAKFWLMPLQLARSTGFSAREINHLRELIFQHQILFKERWYEYFEVEE